MELDWFTLTAQIINFLVLVWLLKRFLYGRIIQAMNEREAKIAHRLEDAARMRAEAEREAELFRTRNRELEEQREQWLTRAREEAEAYRQQLMEAARKEVEAAQAQWLESLERERQELLRELRERLGQQVFAFARHALKELANAELEGQMLKVFVERLQSLAPTERDALIAAVRNSDSQIDVRTAFPVLPEVRECLSRSLREQLDDNLDVRFTTVPELICGVELQADSHRLTWNLDSYFEGLEAQVFDLLEERAQKDAKAAG